MKTNKYGEVVDVEEELNGVTSVAMMNFIEVRVHRYMPIFRKNKDKHFFIGFNFAALLFGPFWLFYRRMIKNTVIYVLLLAVLCAAIFTIVITDFNNKTEANIELKSQTFYENSEGNNIFYANNNTVDFYKTNVLYPRLYKQLLYAFSAVWFTCSTILSIFADCIYRNYMLENINFSNGGVLKRRYQRDYYFDY